jgi:polyhydroxyalkanoate synthesis regulator phasin
MNINEEKSWEDEAKRQISICCETLCDKVKVEEYIVYLERKIRKLEDELSGYRSGD